MADITRIEPGARMSQCVVYNGIATTAGQVAQRAPGASVADQTKDILAKIDELLAEAGTSKANAISAYIWLADIGDFAEMNEVWDAWVAAGSTPARACVEAKLASPKFTVEIQVIAAV